MYLYRFQVLLYLELVRDGYKDEFVAPAQRNLGDEIKRQA